MKFANLFLKYLPVIILIATYAIYNVFDVLEIKKSVPIINDEKCLRIKGAVGIEDIFEYKDVLIGGSDDRHKLWELPQFGMEKTEDGSLVVIDPNRQEIFKRPIKNFPKGIAFHPHGIYIYNNLLYAINHAYSKGGERIEVFEIIGSNFLDIEFIYQRSLIFEKKLKLSGITNDLAVVGKNDELYITSYLPFSDSLEGRTNKSFLEKLLEKLVIMFKIKLTYIYYCKSIKSEFLCSQIPNTSSLMNNGIAFDYKDKLYVSQPLEKRIRVFEINVNDKKQLKYIRDIYPGYAGDNVYFNKDTKELYIGALGKIINHFGFIKDSKLTNNLPSSHDYEFGAIEIETTKDDNVNVLTMFKNNLLGVSSAIKLNDSVYISSWADDGILVCKLN